MVHCRNHVLELLYDTGEGNHDEQRCLIGWLPEIKPKAGSWQLPPGRSVLHQAHVVSPTFLCRVDGVPPKSHRPSLRQRPKSDMAREGTFFSTSLIHLPKILEHLNLTVFRKSEF